MDFEVLIVLFVVVMAVSSLSRKAKQVQQTAQKRTGSPAAAPVKQAKSVKAEAARPSAATPYIDKTPVQPVEYKTIQARVTDPHMEPSYVGSMGGESGEGIDPCHDDEMQRAYALDVRPVDAAAPDIGIAAMFGRDQLLKAVVMSEILARPAQRKWGNR